MKKSQLLGIALLCATMNSYAESIANILTTTTAIGSKLERALEIIKPDGMSHFSAFAGPSIKGRPNDYLGETNNGDGVNSWHQIALKYNISESTKFVFNPRFTINYNRKEAGQKATSAQIDSFVMGIQRTWFTYGKLSFSGGINTTFGTLLSDTDKERGMLYNPGGFQVLNYQQDNALSYGMWISARYRRYSNSDSRDKRGPFTLQPYISYQQNDTIAYTAFFTQNGEVQPDAKTTNWDQDQDFNLMLTYNLPNGLSIQPMITTFRGTNYDISKGNLNLWLSGRFY